MTTMTGAPIDELAKTLRGELITPAEPAYEQARRVRNAMYERQPAAIVRCAGVADVQAALRFAREHALPLAIRCGNHSVHGYGSCDAGLVVDLHAHMRGVWVDPARKLARAQGGADWGDFDRETQVHGLATTGGRVTDTGIAGLTLGSGSGWLERKLGLTCDNLVGAELVTANGDVIRADEELLWGLRGGGGNFGVVTTFEYRLDDVGPIVLGGSLVFPVERACEVVRAWRDLTDEAPDDLGTGVHFYVMPDEPWAPEALRGRPVASVFVLHAGTIAQGEAAIAPLRALRPAMDLVAPTPYTVLQGISDDVLPPDRRNYWKAENLRELPDTAVDVLVDGAVELASTSPLGVVALYPKGRAISRVDERATALAGRSSPFAVYAWSLWSAPGDDAANIESTRALFRALAPHLDAGVSANFSSEGSAAALQASFGSRERYDRLVALKRAYDPGNVFRLNQNIVP